MNHFFFVILILSFILSWSWLQKRPWIFILVKLIFRKVFENTFVKTIEQILRTYYYTYVKELLSMAAFTSNPKSKTPKRGIFVMYDTECNFEKLVLFFIQNFGVLYLDIHQQITTERCVWKRRGVVTLMCLGFSKLCFVQW